MIQKVLNQAKKQPSRVLLLVVILVMMAGYFYSQEIIEQIQGSPCGIQDALQNLTSSWNSYVGTHPTVANILTALYSAFGDIAILVLFYFMFTTSSIQPILPLFVFIILRQIMQFMVSLPLPQGLIWDDPGFPSLFSSYAIDNDFYFSAYVGINLLMTLYLLKHAPELSRRFRWISILGFFIVFYEALVDIVLRSHYTMDIYTSCITAIFSFLFTQKLSKKIDSYFQGLKFYKYGLTLLVLLSIGIYLYIQRIIGMMPIPICSITDQIHIWSEPVNSYLFTHIFTRNMILIFMNSVLDVLSLFILFITIWKRDIRPFLIFFIFFFLRQILQLLVKLPIPDQILWIYPGFPSLLQTYHVSSDFYFSGHTGTSLIAALELSYFKIPWLTGLGFAICAFQAIMVIIMRIHYTMDVFTAIMTVFCFTKFARQVAPRINSFLARLYST